MTHEEELQKLREIYATNVGKKIRRSFTRPLLKGSTIFLITGCMLLVIKLATEATFSWLCVFGTMFAPFWIILGLILTVIAIVIAAVLVIVACIAIVAPFYVVWKQYRQFRSNRIRKSLRAEMERKLAANRPPSDLIDRR